MEVLTLPQVEPINVGLGAKLRMDQLEENPSHINNAYYFDGFLLQLNKNGLLVRTDKTDPIYRACVWKELGLNGKAPSWEKIYGMLCKVHRDTVAKVLCKAARAWIIYQNENLKLFLETLSTQRFTLREVKMILDDNDFDLYFSQLLDARSKLNEYENIFNQQAIQTQSEFETTLDELQQSILEQIKN